VVVATTMMIDDGDNDGCDAISVGDNGGDNENNGDGDGNIQWECCEWWLLQWQWQWWWRWQ